MKRNSIGEGRGLWTAGLVALVIIGSTAGCKPDGSKHLAKEGTPNLRKIFNGAKAYYEKGAVVRRSGTVTSMQFPASAPLTPAAPCYKQSGGKCTSTSWDDAPWKVLGFVLSDAHRLQYQFVSDGEGSAATFTARAVLKDPKQGGWLVLERSASVNGELRVTGDSKPKTRRIKSLDAIALSPRRRELARCRAYGFVPQLDKRGVVVIRAGRVARVAGKGAHHCLKVWAAHCADGTFHKRWPRTCKRAKKRLAGGRDI